MLVVKIAVARLLAEDRLVSGLPILKKGRRLAIGKATQSLERTISKPSLPFERKSGYAVLSKVTNKTSDLVGNAIINELQSFAPLLKTITFDNGKEFAEHQLIDKELQSTTHFADSFASWQRVSNENFNGLLRQYIPKKSPLSTVTQEEIKMIQQQLNKRPRKRLGFKTPNEVFTQSLKRVALRTRIHQI